jgi:hypothetical protein
VKPSAESALIIALLCAILSQHEESVVFVWMWSGLGINYACVYLARVFRELRK